MPRIIACFIFLAGIQVLLGLRHIQYGGVDTQVYARDFMRIVNQQYSFIDIFTGFSKDFGFYLMAKLFTLFSSDMNAWLFVCALPYTIGVTWLIYNYSDDIFLSFIMFMSYGFYLYNFQLMRHVFAIGLIILAFKFLQEGETKKYFITVFLATFCHSIAILFIGAYFLQRGRINARQFLWIIIGGVGVLLLTQESVLIAVFNLIPFLSSGRFAKYSTRGGGFSTDAILWFGFSTLSWIYLYKRKLINDDTGEVVNVKKKNKRFKLSIANPVYKRRNVNMILLFNMTIIATVFYFLTLVIGESYRMAQFFSIFTIILVPNVLHLVKDRRLRLLITSVIVIFGIWHFFGGLFVEGSVYNPYHFFWESTQSLY